MGGQPNMRQGRDENKSEFNLDISDEKYDQEYSTLLKYRERVLKIDKVLTAVLLNSKSKFLF